jgi:hypothetical protein
MVEVANAMSLTNRAAAAPVPVHDRAPVTDPRLTELGRRQALLARMRNVARDAAGISAA